MGRQTQAWARYITNLNCGLPILNQISNNQNSSKNIYLLEKMLLKCQKDLSRRVKASMLTVCNGKILPPKIPSLRDPQGIANLHKTVIFTCIFKEKLIFHFSCPIFRWKTKNRKRARMKFFVFVATHTHNSQLIGIFFYYPKNRDQLLEIWLISHMFLKDQSLAIFFLARR